jgi:deazaflavin-dependent oxidoreductase (nitroreductase family)
MARRRRRMSVGAGDHDMHSPRESKTSPPAERAGVQRPEPFAARLHFIPRLIRPLQAAIVRLFRRYFERAPGWVLLTTTGRRTGLPREVLLPCEGSAEALIVISTYGWQSDWMRNIRRDPRVHVTCAGWAVPAQAEIVDDLDAKRAIVTAHPFFVPAPFAALNFLHRTLLRPVWVPFLRWWIKSRPVVVIRRTDDDASPAPA